MTILQFSKRTWPLAAIAVVAIWFGRGPILQTVRGVRESVSQRFAPHHQDNLSDVDSNAVVANDTSGSSDEDRETASRIHRGAKKVNPVPPMRRTESRRPADDRNAGVAAGDGSTPSLPKRNAPEALLVLSTRERFERNLSTFFSAKNLDWETRTGVLDALCEDRDEMDDIFALSQREGLSDSARNSLLGSSTRRLSDALGNLIGKDATNELLAYQVGRPIAQPFLEQCAAAGVPLSDIAFSAIAANVGTHTYSREQPPNTAPNGWAQFLARQDAAGLAAAEKVLTPEQMNLFRTYWAQHPTRPSFGSITPPARSR